MAQASSGHPTGRPRLGGRLRDRRVRLLRFAELLLELDDTAARFVGRHPWPSAVVAVILLLAIALPALDMRLGQQDYGQFPKSTEARQAYDTLTKGFGPGANGPFLIAVAFDPPVRLKAGEELIDTAAHVAHAGPLAFDLDADGRQDLLVGNFGGHFQVYMNTGSREAPEYADQGLLQAGGADAKVPNW